MNEPDEIKAVFAYPVDSQRRLLIDVARKLARERDEARKLARFEIDGALSYLPEDLVIQHDDAFAAMALTFAKLNQEVSKLRAEVERLKAYEVSESLRRRAEAELTAATVDGDYCRVNKDYWFMLIAERDEARKERERAETKCAAEYEAHKMTKAERDALRAEVGRLKSACEKEFASVQQLNDEVEQLKADKARLDWLEKAKSAEYCEGPRGWSINGWNGPYFATLREAVSDAMKSPAHCPPPTAH
jgi:hypothetical protein